MQSANCFDLSNNILLAKKLEKPIITLFLYNFNFADKLHIWVYSNPQDWITVI